LQYVEGAVFLFLVSGPPTSRWAVLSLAAGG
jgi:hypothetical protein